MASLKGDENMKRLLVGLVVVIAMIWAPPVDADTISFHFEGHVTSTKGAPWLAGIGDTFTGRFSYDTTTPETGDSFRTFKYTPHIDGPIEFVVSIGDNTLTSRHIMTYREQTFGGSQTINLGVGAENVAVAGDISSTLDSMGILLQDEDGAARFGFEDPIRASLNFHDLSVFESAHIGFRASTTQSVTGVLTRLSFVEPVPAPTALVNLIGLAVAGLAYGYWRRRRK